MFCSNFSFTMFSLMFFPLIKTIVRINQSLSRNQDRLITMTNHVKIICHFDQSILIFWQWLVYSDYRFYYLYWSYQLVQSFFPLLPKVFSNILKIYELPKIYNNLAKYCQTLVLTIIIYQVNSMSQLHLAFELHPY